MNRHSVNRLTLYLLYPLLLLCLPWLARADSDTHYQDYLVGERAAGMGGAFVALANEATGAYYNPAGLISGGSTLLQLSMSAYKLRQREVQVADICGTAITDDDNGFFGFPGSLGFVHQFRTGKVRHGLALTVVVPHWDRSSQLYTSGDRSILCGQRSLTVGGSQMMVDRVFWGGVSYAIKPWRALQIGATAGVTIRSYSHNTLMALVSDEVNTFPIIAFYNMEAVQWSFFAQLGVIVTPAEGFRLGLTFTTPYARLVGGGRADIIYAAGLAQDKKKTGALVLDDVETYWEVPFRLSLGAAYSHKKRFAVALDVTLHGPVDSYPVIRSPELSDAGLEGKVGHNRRDVVVNVNLGAEVALLKKLALRVGFFTNLSSYPNEEGLDDFDHVQKLGFTIGGTYRSTRRSALSLAIQGQVGELNTTATRISVGPKNTPVSEEFDVEATDLSLILSVGGNFDIR